MNTLMRDYYPTFVYYQALRTQLMQSLEDEDLRFQLPGNNLPLGALCVDIGETQVSYIQSFKTFKQDFSYRSEDPQLRASVSRLVQWYEQLDSELESVLEGLTENDLHTRLVDRGGGFELPLHIQLDVYKEALLIFYGKVSVYLKALQKELPPQWQDWIA